MIFIEPLPSLQPSPKKRAGTDTFLLCDTMLITRFPLKSGLIIFGLAVSRAFWSSGGQADIAWQNKKILERLNQSSGVMITK
jgi:hypothetical protein